MSKIKIKHFGPIKEGCLENDGWIDIKKVTVFIGDQGSGKSTVAKVICTLMWLEKAFNRGEIDYERLTVFSNMDYYQFRNFFGHQGLQDYFKSNTEIEYQGEEFSIIYRSKDELPVIEPIVNSNYIVPKIMYVPAERNTLSTIENIYKAIIPQHLFPFAEELKKAQKELYGKILDLPLNNYKYEYDELKDSSFVHGKDHKVNLLNASSGLQSIIPLYLVSRNLADLVTQQDEVLRKNMDADSSIRMNQEINSLMLDNTISEVDRTHQLNSIRSKYISKCFINIVEEPEQNLFPTSQWQMLKSLLGFNNRSKQNKLIITTHSPYIINYLTLAVKAYELKQKVKTTGLLIKIEDIVPFESTVDSNDLVIYELDEKDGTIKQLEDYKGLPSDENQLNEKLEEGNELFAQLLEIQQEA
jgi:predicted ATPase